MRYIRTKEGKIFDTHYLDKYNSLEPRFIIEENRLIIFDLRNEKLIANHGEVLKQADTIEELFDCVIYEHNGYQNLIEDIIDFRRRNRKLFNEDLIVYGAIWTNKGLIYVAKMNEKGDFELL